MVEKLNKVKIQLPKTPTGIKGLDTITLGGLPKGRTTLVCGKAGCGKTLLGMEFLAHGASEYNEPGVFLSFEETVDDLIQNTESLGFGIKELINDRKLVIDHVHIERNEMQETGEYNLEGLFIRLAYAIDSIGANRVVLDTIETLFGGLSNPSIIRAELKRLFVWLKQKGVTSIVTAESGKDSITRSGIDEYVSDCVLILDHRIVDQLSTRRIRIAKYRGSSHGTNEYPFLIDVNGISVLPLSSLTLDHMAHEERIPSGIDELDEMLGGAGYYRGSSILISGAAGCGKSSMAAHFADATCRRGERCLMFLFEESPSQLLRNMRSIGFDLEQWESKGLLKLLANRPTRYGLEMHLVQMIQEIEAHHPDVVVFDPISSFWRNDKSLEIEAMLARTVDFLKSKGITAMMLNLNSGGEYMEHTNSNVSSVIDTWLLLRNVEQNGQKNRNLYIIKSRGMSHSNKIRKFMITNDGIQVSDVERVKKEE